MFTVQASDHGAACGSESVPSAITKKLDRTTGLLDRAEQQSNAKSAKLRQQAKHVLAGAGTAARKAAKGKKPKLPAACAAAIRQAVAAMTAGL